MSRWLVLAVLSGLPLLSGCGSAVRPGLSNAPRLGGSSVADEGIHDVVSNGDDACGLYSEHGVLRNRIPPCPHVHPVASTAWMPTSTQPPGQGLVSPWLKHFYVGWPCPHAMSMTESKAVAWSSPIPPSTACSTSEH
jgi:hypothetical protein